MMGSWVRSTIMAPVKQLKLALRLGGLGLLLFGVMCLPIGYGVSPKRDSSFFYNLADAGAFIKIAAISIVGGLAALTVSAVLPGKLDE